MDKRLRRNRKGISIARQRVMAGKARDYILPFQVEPGDLFIIASRVSTGPQEDNGNLDDQVALLTREVSVRGGIVVDVVREACSGFDPFWLVKAAKIARRENGTILAECTDRLIRHPAYHSFKNPDLQATEAELRYLRRMVGDVRLMTFLDPEATPKEVRNHRTRRGQEMKRNRGGRPPTKPGHKRRRRETMLPRVLYLLEQGISQRDVQELTGIPQSTIQYWNANYTID